MTRKVLAVLLAALMLFFVFVGCATPDHPDEQTTPVDTPDQETTTEKPEPTFVDKKYNADFVVYTRPEKAANYPGMYIVSDAVSDVMSAAVYNRNLMVEEKYAVKISTIETDNPYKDLSKHIQAGSVNYDVILDRRQYLATPARTGLLYDFNKLDHVDFTQPYWDINCKDGYEVNGKLFFMANDISVSNLSGVRFFYFNKKLIADYSLDDPYTLVENNQWTLDKLLSMITSVSTDNGDGIWDGNDTYGLLLESPAILYFMLVGCGQTFTTKLNDGTIVTDIYNEKTESIMTKLYNSVETTNYAISYQNAAKGMDMEGLNVWNFVRTKLFTTDHFLFLHSSLGAAHQFADMESDYGVVPNPKYDSSQENYYHRFDKNTLIWSIPNSDQMDYDKIGAIMEYWSYASSSTVMPAYYEITIKTKRVREETASKMIDIVKANMRYDLDDVFSAGIDSVLKSGYGKGTLASSWESSKESINNKLAQIYEDISALQ